MLTVPPLVELVGPEKVEPTGNASLLAALPVTVWPARVLLVSFTASNTVIVTVARLHTVGASVRQRL